MKISPALIFIAIFQSSLAVASGSDRLTRADAHAVGAAILPEQCGTRGERCGYAYSDRASSPCAFDVFIQPPTATAVEGQPKVIWVGLDHRRRIVAIGSHAKFGRKLCLNDKSAS